MYMYIYNIYIFQIDDGPFNWDKSLQGHILGSFFYGYVISQIPGGMLAEKYGGKWVFFFFLLLSTIATVLTPVAATISPYVLIAVRIICGLGSVSITIFTRDLKRSLQNIKEIRH